MSEGRWLLQASEPSEAVRDAASPCGSLPAELASSTSKANACFPGGSVLYGGTSSTPSGHGAACCGVGAVGGASSP